MSPPLPFNFDTAGVLDSTPRWVGVAGAIYVASQPSADPPPVLSVAWLDEPPDAHLDEVLAEELARLDPASVLIDYEPVPLNGVRAVRTLTIHREGSGALTASEQWRLLAAGRRWTISASTGLLDQPEYGPRLAAVAQSFTVAS